MTLLDLTLIGLALVAVGYALHLIARVHDGFDASPLDCSCRRHAWDPRCPIHGRRTSA